MSKKEWTSACTDGLQTQTAVERERAHEGAAEGEAGCPLSREPNTGLDPRTLGHDPSRRQTLH